MRLDSARRRRRLDRQRGAAAFAIRRLDRVGEPRHGRRPRCAAGPRHAPPRRHRASAAASPTPPRTPPLARRPAAGRSRVAAASRSSAISRVAARCRPGGRAPVAVPSTRRRPGRVSLVTRRHALRPAGGCVRRPASSKPIEQPRALGQVAEPRRPPPRPSRGSTSLPALAAERPADAREQQPHVVVDLGRRADGRPRIADAVLLPDGDRRGRSLDAIDVGLLHPLEELAGVGRERLDVAPLPLGVDRVEGERRLARPADAREDHELPVWQRQVDALQIVGAGAPNDECPLRPVGRNGRRFRHGAHGGRYRRLAKKAMLLPNWSPLPIADCPDSACRAILRFNRDSRTP